MDSKKFCFITCVNDERWYSECKLYLENLIVPDGFSTEFIPIRNAKSMTSGYNSAMQKSNAKYKIYLHQDTLVVNKNLLIDLLDIFSDESISLIGMIGCMSLPESGIWWDGLRQFGRVLHACEPESVVDTKMNQPDGKFQLVEVVDGLFMATQIDLPWREDLFDDFHFYDVSQCLEMKRRGFKIAIPNQDKEFWCMHCPKEKPLSPSYKIYKRRFQIEYAGEFQPEV